MNAITESNTDTFDYPLELRDYWAMVVRRKWTFILPLLAVVGAAVALLGLIVSVLYVGGRLRGDQPAAD